MVSTRFALPIEHQAAVVGPAVTAEAMRINWAPIVANGAAIIAMAGLVGSSSTPDAAFDAVIWPVVLFAVGMLFGTASMELMVHRGSRIWHELVDLARAAHLLADMTEMAVKAHDEGPGSIDRERLLILMSEMPDEFIQHLPAPEREEIEKRWPRDKGPTPKPKFDLIDLLRIAGYAALVAGFAVLIIGHHSGHLRFEDPAASSAPQTPAPPPTAAPASTPAPAAPPSPPGKSGPLPASGAPG